VRLGARLGRSPFSSSEWLFLDELRRVRSLAGLPEQPVSPDAVRAERVIGLWPSWFSPPQSDWPAGTRLSGFPFYPTPPAPGGIGAGGDDSQAVVFLRGSAATRQRSFFEEAVRCCRLLERPGVIVTPHADDVPRGLPATVSHVAFAPLGELFSRAGAVVHHGGIGTTAYALAAGIPQVVVPIVADQFDLGYRMERLGVGSMLTQAPVPAARLARELRALCGSERVRRRCQAVRDQVDPEAGCSRAADWIEEVIASRQIAARGRA
jgi:UDP:flavonoid glycosyltransferase YjiC (YdhE family)